MPRSVDDLQIGRIKLDKGIERRDHLVLCVELDRQGEQLTDLNHAHDGLQHEGRKLIGRSLFGCRTVRRRVAQSRQRLPGPPVVGRQKRRIAGIDVAFLVKVGAGIVSPIVGRHDGGIDRVYAVVPVGIALGQCAK